jgi:hypothetical protein
MALLLRLAFVDPTGPRNNWLWKTSIYLYGSGKESKLSIRLLEVAGRFEETIIFSL